MGVAADATGIDAGALALYTMGPSGYSGEPNSDILCVVGRRRPPVSALHQIDARTEATPTPSRWDLAARRAAQPCVLFEEPPADLGVQACRESR